jgi:hypothetical protein
MGLDCNLTLRAKIKKSDGKTLAEFCRDWMFIKYLKTKPKEGYLRKTYESCQSLFQNFVDEESIAPLERGILELEFEGKFDTVGVEVLVEDFLPRALIRLEEFFYEIPEFGNGRTEYRFDPKSRKLTRIDGVPSPSSKSDALAWDDEYGYLPPEIWRRNLLKILELIANKKLQTDLLVRKIEKYDFDPPYTDFEIWFDINAYYMGRLNLEDGFGHAKKEKFLNASECESLAAFDGKFRKYLPDDMITPNANSILTDPKWNEIVASAQHLLQTGFLGTRNRGSV